MTYYWQQSNTYLAVGDTLGADTQAVDRNKERELDSMERL